jgi:UDP-N-acetyl-D-mannosaminuronate dehydrogenase
VDGEAVPRAQALQVALARADLTIVLTDHAEYDAMLTRHARLLFDTRGSTRAVEVPAAVELL